MNTPLPPETIALIAGDKGAALGDVSGAIAGWYAAGDEGALAKRVSADLGRFTGANSIVVLEFRTDLQPRMIFAKGRSTTHDLGGYITGFYAVDPFYDLFAVQRSFGVFHVNLEGRDEFDLNEVYRRHISRSVGRDEIGILLDMGQGQCIHISLLLSLESDDQVRGAMDFCKAVLVPLTEAFRQKVAGPKDEPADPRREVHRIVTRAIEGFGADILTPREQEVATLLLKGHSAKSMARMLDIAPGTAALHRANVYRKLGINGQGDLFAAFLSQLMGT
ncbi:helix-turn-helix transcriptional regulator [Shimia biformata]|uniref:helix-turn-helix transcriptional regulator n=1 Tax=Shimia biformata TaxID=1294299 RepID=UPI00194FA959|nr:LuxR C-terminal-related transcriptional regulator [Shimia biformata]